MADMFLGESAGPEVVSGASVMGGIVNWTGALMSVALVGGLALWGYQLTVRDVSGVPVVRALEGPMRVAPDDPGGEQMDHQGLAVNAVAADGAAEGPVDRLELAPPPLELSDEDVPVVPLPEPENAPIVAEVLPEEAPEIAADTPPSEEAPTPEPPSADDVLALAERIAEEATPLSAPSEAPEISSDPIPESIRGVSASPFPIPRPGGDEIALAVAESVALAVAPESVEVDPSAVTSGTRLVQFGAFASAEAARDEWRKIDIKFTDFLTDKKRVIERAVSGGKTFYRLRALGFEDIADARRFCSAFVASNQACIPVVAR